MIKNNILVTGSGGGVGQGIIKCLKMISDLKIKIICADMSELSTGLYSGDACYIVPPCTSNNYLSILGEIFLKEKIEFYFPGTDNELEFCAKQKDYIKKKYNVKVVISDLKTIFITNDKYKTSNFLLKNNLPYPKTYLFSDFNSKSISYPVIVKPRNGSRSIDVYIIKNKTELDNIFKNRDDLIIQELIGTKEDEYTCTVVISKKQISDVIILKRILRSGDTYRAELVNSKKIETYVKNVARVLNINGSCNFQLRVDSEGIPKIFEINCRFSGTTPFCAQLGFNPVEYYLKKDLGIDYNYNLDKNKIVMRYWSEVLIDKHLISRIKMGKKTRPFFKKVMDLFNKT